jgi:Tol biopolymer transport system component
VITRTASTAGYARRKGEKMTKASGLKAATILASTLVAVLLLVSAAMAQTVETTTFPGSTGDIAFVGTRDGGSAIYRMSGDGVRQTRLTEAGLNQDPAWSADGKKIVYTDRNWDDIFQMNADGSDQRNLNRADGMDFSPAYFPTGTKVAFTGVRGEGFQYDIYTMTLSANGQVTGLTRITTTQDADDMQPTVSPDGKRLAFVSDRDGDRDIYVMKAAPESATNRPVKLTKSPATDQSPDWSPDGTKLAFMRGESMSFEVMAMRAAPEGRTNRPVNLSRSPADDGYPTWSPDGKKVAFHSNRVAPDSTSDYDIWRVRATDGANPTNLTNAPGNDTSPDWQPLP